MTARGGREGSIDENIRVAVAFAIAKGTVVNAGFLANVIARSEGLVGRTGEIATRVAEAAVAARVPVLLPASPTSGERQVERR